MAQKRKRNKKKKWVSWLVMLILLVVAAAVAYLVWDSYFKGKEKKVNDEQQTSEQVEEKEKGELDEEVVVVQEEDGEKKVVQYEGEDPNKAENLSGAVTYAGVNGDKLIIRVNIDQFLDGGECALSLERSGATIYNDTANVVGGVATATCEGFDVPVGQVGSGSLDIKITVSAGEKTGTINGRVDI